MLTVGLTPDGTSMTPVTARLSEDGTFVVGVTFVKGRNAGFYIETMPDLWMPITLPAPKEE